MTSTSDKFSEPCSGSTVNSKVRNGLEQVKERQKSIQKKRSPKGEREAAAIIKKPIPQSLVRHGSPKISRGTQGSPKLIAQRYQRDMQQSSAQELTGKTKAKKLAPSTRNNKQVIKQMDSVGFSRTELSNIIVETIIEQDSHLATNPTPNNASQDQ